MIWKISEKRMKKKYNTKWMANPSKRTSGRQNLRI
jgi:hypothetical protein